MISDELGHMLRQVMSQALAERRSVVYGHIATYDPENHRVRCIIPSLADDDGVPLLSPWMPMGSLSAGAGYGIQVVYAGGATVENPTAGEQVMISLFDNQRGVAAVPAVFFNRTSRPPSTALPDGASPIVPHDVLISNPSGSLLRLHANGDWEIHGVAKLTANVVGDATITTEGNALVTTEGTATVAAEGDATVTTQGTATVQAQVQANVLAPVINLGANLANTLRGLCTDVFRTLFNSHTHQGVHGTTSAPLQQADASTVTSVVRAE